MGSGPGSRPGGRSKRIQLSVHEATRRLLEEHPRDQLSIPLVADRAGVTPSTLYRRWGGLDGLLSDVATAELRPDQEPADLGSLSADLLEWLTIFNEEMSSDAGRAMILDVLAAGDQKNAVTCSDYAADQIDVVLERARRRGEAVPSRERILDALVAPLMYRILFRPQQPAEPADLVHTFFRVENPSAWTEEDQEQEVMTLSDSTGVNETGANP